MATDAEALEELLLYYLEGVLRYPRLTKAHLHAPLVTDDYSGPFGVLMAPVSERLRDALHAIVPGLSAWLPSQPRSSQPSLAACISPSVRSTHRRLARPTRARWRAPR